MWGLSGRGGKWVSGGGRGGECVCGGGGWVSGGGRGGGWV